MNFFENHRDYFALNIFEQKIKVVRIGKSGKKPVDFATINLPEAAIKNGRILDKKGVAGKLKDFLQSSKITQKFVAVGLSESPAFTQVLTFPKLVPTEMTQAIKWRSESFLPIRYEEAYLDWKKVKEENSETSILIVALPKELVDGYVQVCHLAGIKPVALETRVLSLSRLVNPKITNPVLMLEIESSEATLAIIDTGQTLQTTSVLKESSLDQKSLSETIDNLIRFFEEKKAKGRKVEKIILCGPQATSSLAKALEKKTKRKAELLSLTSFPHLSSKDALEYATTISLAQKDVAAPIDEKTINLLPPKIQGVYDLNLRKKRLSFWTNAYAFVLILALLGFSLASLSLFLRLKTVNQELSKREISVSPEQRKIWQRAKNIKAKMATVNTLLAKTSVFPENLSLLPSLLPEGITLTDYSWDEKKNEVVINGTALKRSNLLRFRENLEQTGQFQKIKVPLASLEKATNLSFTLTLKLKNEES